MLKLRETAPRRHTSHVFKYRKSSDIGQALTVLQPGMLSSMLRGIMARPAPALTQASIP